MLRRYFLIDTVQASEAECQLAKDACIGLNKTYTFSPDATQMIIKTTQDQIDSILSSLIQESYVVEKTIEEVTTLLIAWGVFDSDSDE